jgi:hypothetical protein
MYSAPNFCGPAGFLPAAAASAIGDARAARAVTHERRTLLMKLRIGTNVVFVRFVASLSRNVVAADTGLS